MIKVRTRYGSVHLLGLLVALVLLVSACTPAAAPGAPAAEETSLGEAATGGEITRARRQ